MTQEQLLTAAMQAQQAGNAQLALHYTKMAQFVPGQKNDPSSLTPVGPYAHGPGGLFNIPGTNPRIFSAMQLPMQGLADALPMINAGMDGYAGPQEEFFAYITGVTEGSEAFADQPTAECADGARAGLLKSGRVAISYGHYRHAPNAPINLRRVGKFNNLADPLNMQLVNEPASAGTLFSNIGGAGIRNVVNSELSKRLYELHVTMKRFIAPRTYIGSPANNNGAARDIMGLNLWINTSNKRDADTGAVLTALDSDVKDFGYDRIDGNGRDIVDYVETMYMYLDWNSRHQGFGPWDGWIVMRPELFDELTKVWPIRQYNELIAQVGTLNNGAFDLSISARDELAMRNDLRTGSYLPIRGRRVEVIQDDAIQETTPNQTAQLQPGEYASTVYFVPRSILGGSTPVTFWKYQDQANPQAEAFIRATQNSIPAFTSDGGLYYWDINYKNRCLDMTVGYEPALLMLTPQLAGRIDNVAYSPLQHVRSYDPNSDYFTNGGRLNTAQQQFYTPWSETPTNI